MTKTEKIFKNLNLLLGLASMAFFVFDYVLFSRLRPKMVGFEPLSLAEEGLFSWLGVGLLLFLVFCLLSLLRIIRYLKKAKKITFFSIFLVVSGVLALLFVFADVALLGDIGKQYRHGLSQPEWGLLYPIMTFQFMTAAAFSCWHLFGFKKENQVKQVVQDSNLFLITQYVGLTCGLMGLSLSSLGFLFPRAWRLGVHTTISSMILLTPYVLVLGYWFLTKLKEKQRPWYDEKQLQDLGKSALLALIINALFMTLLFIANYHNLKGVLSITWLPLYLFSVLFLFSLGNLYFSGKE